MVPEVDAELEKDYEGQSKTSAIEKWFVRRFRMVLRLYLVKAGKPPIVTGLTNEQIAEKIKNMDRTTDMKPDVEGVELGNEKNDRLTKFADPDLHMISMDMQYTHRENKKMYTI